MKKNIPTQSAVPTIHFKKLAPMHYNHTALFQSISGMTSSVQCVAFNNSENWLGAGSKSGVMKVFDLDANRSKKRLQTLIAVQMLLFVLFCSCALHIWS